MSALSSVIGRGTHAARPAAGTPGALYYETDTSTMFRDNGSSWDNVEASAGGARELGYTSDTTSRSTSSSTYADLGTLNVTITAPGTPIWVEVFMPRIAGPSAGDRLQFNISDVTGSTIIQELPYAVPALANDGFALFKVRVTPAAGSRQYKVQWKVVDAGTYTTTWSGSYTAYITCYPV